MLTLLLAAAVAAPAPASTALDAEYAFARDAQTTGQWTAFRKYATHDAVMFTPQVVWAHEFLNDRKDPPESVKWWPTLSLVSCDGRTAVNTGPWTRNGGKLVGHFTTIWMHDSGKWRWIYDGGQSVEGPAPKQDKPQTVKGSCHGAPTGAPLIAPPPAVRRPGEGPPDGFGRGFSVDQTLAWDWKVDEKGGRTFRAFLWNGTHYAQMLYQYAPPE
jgi:hypothetical protein